MTAIAGGVFGFLLAVRRHPGRPAAVPADGPDDLLGRRLELRRRPAGPRLHLHPRPAGFVTRSCATASASTSTHGGFTLYSKLGLEIVYLYFQFPLMVLIIAPAIDGLKREWREAAENMGATASSTGAAWRCRS